MGFNLADTKSQPSQLISANSNDCVRVRHKNNKISINYGLPESQTLGNNNYSINFTIQNICSHPIHIIESETINNSYNNNFELVYNRIDNISNNDVITEVSPSEQSPGFVDKFVETLFCPNCFPGGVPSSVSTVNNANIVYYSIPANSFRDFTSGVTIPVGSYFGNSYAYSYPARVALERIKWFKQNALSDGNVSAAEIRTYVIPSSLSNYFSTDFSEIEAVCLCEGMTQEEIEKMKKEMGLKSVRPLDPKLEQKTESATPSR